VAEYRWQPLYDNAGNYGWAEKIWNNSRKKKYLQWSERSGTDGHRSLGGKDRKILSVPCCKSPFWTCRTETSGRCNSVIEIYYREKKQCTD